MGRESVYTCTKMREELSKHQTVTRWEPRACSVDHATIMKSWLGGPRLCMGVTHCAWGPETNFGMLNLDLILSASRTSVER